MNGSLVVTFELKDAIAVSLAFYDLLRTFLVAVSVIALLNLRLC